MEFKGDAADALKYRKIAENYTAYWQAHAKATDGSHYKLAYGACTINRPCAQQYVGKTQSCMVIDMDDSSWSQKYNLVWDKILKLNLVPQDVFDTEIAFCEFRWLPPPPPPPPPPH